MVLVQKWPFFELFFLANIGHENVLHDLLKRKNVDIFPKRLTHGFGPKMAIFPTFLF